MPTLYLSEAELETVREFQKAKLLNEGKKDPLTTRLLPKDLTNESVKNHQYRYLINPDKETYTELYNQILILIGAAHKYGTPVTATLIAVGIGADVDACYEYINKYADKSIEEMVEEYQVYIEEAEWLIKIAILLKEAFNLARLDIENLRLRRHIDVSAAKDALQDLKFLQSEDTPQTKSVTISLQDDI